MNNILSILPIATGAGIAAYFIPDSSYRFAVQRCQQKGWELPANRTEPSWRFLSVIFCMIYSIFSGAFMSPILTMFSVLFCLIAIFGFFVDLAIRIIANKMLLCMLAVGIPYRLISGGISSIPGAFAALFMVAAIFGAAAALTYFKSGVRGVGMGDVKLSMVIAITVGWPGVIYFLAGMALAIIGYCGLGLFAKRLFLNSTFPMCGHIMAGFLMALVIPYLPYL